MSGTLNHRETWLAPQAGCLLPRGLPLSGHRLSRAERKVGARKRRRGDVNGRYVCSVKIANVGEDVMGGVEIGGVQRPLDLGMIVREYDFAPFLLRGIPTSPTPAKNSATRG